MLDSIFMYTNNINAKGLVSFSAVMAAGPCPTPHTLQRRQRGRSLDFCLFNYMLLFTL